MNGLRAWIVAGATALVVACGAANGGGAHGQAIGRLVIVIVPPADPLPFDPRSVRLAQAARELADIVGAPVSFELDAALLPEYRASFEEQLIASIENAARDLASLKKDAPRVFERAAPSIGTIACRYKATAEHADAVLSPEARTLTITEPPGSRALVERGLVREAVIDEFEAFLDRRYHDKEPAQVPEGERAAYFEYLTRTRPGRGNLIDWRARQSLQGMESTVRELEAHGQSLVRIAALGELLGKSVDPVAVAVRAHLVDEARDMDLRERTDHRAILDLPKDSQWRRAEATYVRWLSTNASALTDSETRRMVEVMFPAMIACREEDVRDPCWSEPPSFPGFDRFQFGLAVVDAWRSEGRPRDGIGDHFAMLDGVVCPHQTAPDGKRTRNRSCASSFYHYAIATPAASKRLAAALVQRHDPMVVDEVFANLERELPARVMALWRALENDPPEWQAASHVVLEHLLKEARFESAIVDEANRFWQRGAERRGVALFALGWKYRTTDRHYADPQMLDFPKRYGAPVSEGELRQLLALGPLAVPLVPVLWPALGKGYARIDVLAPRLDAFFADRGASSGEPSKTLHALVERLCADGDAAGLARLHAVLVARVQAHPDDAAPLGTLLADTTHCKPSPARGRSGFL